MYSKLEKRIIDLEVQSEILQRKIEDYNESRIKEILLEDLVVLVKKAIKIIYGIFIVLLSSVAILHIINLIKSIG